MFRIFKRSTAEAQPAAETPAQPAGPDEITAPLQEGVHPTEGGPAQPGAGVDSAQPLPETPAPAEISQPTAIPENLAAQPIPEPEQAIPVIPAAQPRKSIFYYLFSPERRFGRFMRVLLRWLGAITGLFALGLLAGYILIYQPTQRELDAALLRLAQADQVVAQKDQGQQVALADRDQAQKTLQQAQDDLKKAASDNQLLMVLVEVNNARVALVNKDGAAAKTAIQQAQANLVKAMPFLESQDKTRSDVLQSRLDLVAKELVSDPQAALSDLDKLSVDLADIHKKVFGN